MFVSVLVGLQDGVNWLGFLNKYKLHGILCDDMGLGKTLQTICIIAGDHDKLKKGEVILLISISQRGWHVLLYVDRR